MTLQWFKTGKAERFWQCENLSHKRLFSKLGDLSPSVSFAFYNLVWCSRDHFLHSSSPKPAAQRAVSPAKVVLCAIGCTEVWRGGKAKKPDSGLLVPRVRQPCTPPKCAWIWQAVSPPANFGWAASTRPPPPGAPAPPPWSIWNISTLKWTSFSPPLVVLGKQRRPRRPSTSRPVPTRAGGGKVGAGLPPVPPAPPRSPAWACASPKCVFWMRQRISCLVSALRLRRGGIESEQSQSREGQVQVAVQEGAGGGEPGSLVSPLPLPFSFLYFSLPFFFPLQPPFSFFLTSPPASPLPPQPREGDVGTIPSVWYVCVNIISSYELTRWRFSFLTNRSLPQ